MYKALKTYYEHWQELFGWRKQAVFKREMRN